MFNNDLYQLNSNFPYKIWEVIVPIDVNIEGMKEIPYPTGCNTTNTNFLTFTVMYDLYVKHLTTTTSNLLDIQLLKDKIIVYAKSNLVVGKEVTLFFISNIN